MKVLIILALLSLSSVSFADTTISEVGHDSPSSNLDLVIGVHQTYSKTSELDAKIIEILAGDGMNATRMVLVLNTGYHDTKIFELGKMMVEVKRITFLAKDLVVVNYTQDSFDAKENQILVNKSVTIQVLRNANGTLANEINIIE